MDRTGFVLEEVRVKSMVISCDLMKRKAEVVCGQRWVGMVYAVNIRELTLAL